MALMIYVWSLDCGQDPVSAALPFAACMFVFVAVRHSGICNCSVVVEKHVLVDLVHWGYL